MQSSLRILRVLVLLLLVVLVAAIGAYSLWLSPVNLTGEDDAFASAYDDQDSLPDIFQSDEVPVLPPEAGMYRDPQTCVPGEPNVEDVALVLRTLDGQESEVENVKLADDAPQWPGLSAAVLADTSAFDERLHLIGMGADGVGVGNRQFLADPASPALSASGLVSLQGLMPFGEVRYLSKQLPAQAQAAPISARISGQKVIWLEQLVTGGAQYANRFPWRIMTADARENAPVAELISSYAITGQETAEAPTPWHAPAITSTHAAIEYVAATPQSGVPQARIGIVRVENPGIVEKDYQGRLPIAVGEKIAWVEDTTSFGLDAEKDIFTIRWADQTTDPIVLETGKWAKLQGVEANERFFILAFQDSCVGLTWLAKYDQSLQKVVSWVVTRQDRVALSLNDDVLVWGNGSGNRGSEMYRWDLTTDELFTLGSNEGYSVPFSAGKHTSVVPDFNVRGGAPLVAWQWLHTND